ncbi:hypothetical protein [Clostridium grantii]|uniref:Lipoprotein n=1 Tax=Clostridium grantii DSM 8605 TaxID=1121316 RepID=A0A1M5VF35_9CLOT|nr:hypothetical protein [Clostridium grantii]SHH73785.1 hypothetical protein SAMN02745207_02260 [Clostridium grantii DSM 8605]
MKKRILSSILVFLLIVTSMAGCAKNQKLNGDNLEAQVDGVKLKISSLTLDEQAECIIKKVDAPAVMGEIEVDAYDFSIDTQEELAAILELVIPYKKSDIEEGMTAEESVGAGYYNEETKEWEPVILNMKPYLMLPMKVMIAFHYRVV